MSQPRIALGALVGGAIGFWVAEQFAEYYRVRARGRPRTSNCPPPNPLELKRQLLSAARTALAPPRRSKSASSRTATCA